MSDQDNACRCCLEQFKDHLSFSEKITVNKKVWECFEAVTSIEPSDFQSKICRNCYDQLKNAYEFRMKCLMSNKRYPSRAADSWKQIEGMRIKQEVDKVCVRVVTEEDSFLNSQLEIKEEQLNVDSFPDHRTDRTAQQEYQNHCTKIHSKETSQQRQVFTVLHQIVLTSIDYSVKDLSILLRIFGKISKVQVKLMTFGKFSASKSAKIRVVSFVLDFQDFSETF
jgi:hypothetical protein